MLTETIRIETNDAGLVTAIRGDSGINQAVPHPLTSVVVGGESRQATAATLDGDVLTISFDDTQVSLAIELHAAGILFRVTESSESIESLHFKLGVKSQSTVAPNANATYSDNFGLMVHPVELCTSQLWGVDGGSILSVRAEKRYGVVGAEWLVVAGDRFHQRLKPSMRSLGLWTKPENQLARQSCLFVDDLTIDNAEQVARYAVAGGFGYVLFRDWAWLKTVGTFEPNTSAFPRGHEDVARAVAIMHGYGLRAECHLIGPAISKNDPLANDPRLLRDEQGELREVYRSYLPDPTTDLLDEIAANFADVFERCGFDGVYFDGNDMNFDGSWYYQDRAHKAFSAVLPLERIQYQSSNGVGKDRLWRLTTRCVQGDFHDTSTDEAKAAAERQAVNFGQPILGWYDLLEETPQDGIARVVEVAKGLGCGMVWKTTERVLRRRDDTQAILDLIASHSTVPIPQRLTYWLNRVAESQERLQLARDAYRQAERDLQVAQQANAEAIEALKQQVTVLDAEPRDI